MTTDANLCRLCDDYLDDSLDPAQLVRFEQHLLRCDACCESVQLQQRLEQRVREYASTIAPARDWTPPPHPEESRRSATPSHSGSLETGLWMVCGLAASLLVIAFLTFGSRRIDSGDTTKTVQHELPGETIGASTETTNTAEEHVGESADIETPVIHSVRSENHLPVVDAEVDDGITFVMLYQKVIVSNEPNTPGESLHD